MRILRSQGSMMLEFVLTMPILFIVIMLVVQFAQIWIARQMVAYAAFCSARSILSANICERNPFLRQKIERCDHAAARQALAWMGSASSSGRLVKIPGWGTIPESGAVDKRLKVESLVEDGKYAYSTVVYSFPLLVPVAGAMVSFLAQHQPEESRYVQYANRGILFPGWTGETEEFDGVPYVDLTETCVLPLPYSTESLPLNGYVYP